MRQLITLISLLLLLSVPATAQEIIPLYPGTAPGSENYPKPESADTLAEQNLLIIRNVSQPTLTVYKPERPNGTAVIVCPGGAFRALFVKKEGEEIAQWLNDMGITVFVLKYRLTPSDPASDKVVQEALDKGDFAKLETINAPYVPLAIADGLAAIQYVRENASRWKLETNRIGIMGFSAGATLSAVAGLNYGPKNRPDFVAPIYGYFGDMNAITIPNDAPPFFLALASNDPIAFGNPAFYEKMNAAEKSVELHIYPEGGHGFGIRPQYVASDQWVSDFKAWLDFQDLLTLQSVIEVSGENHRKNRIGYRKWKEKMFFTDWPWLARFDEENKQLMKAGKKDNRVVFMGNSITQGWSNIRPDFFANPNYVNRGISGQTTPQMLVRFQQDVIDLSPAVVVILAGTNDIAGNTGDMTLAQIMNNMKSMTTLAKANGIEVVLCSVLPAFDYRWEPGRDPASKIPVLNAMIKAYAEQNDCIYADYFSAMADDRNGLPPSLAHDGVHPNNEGYQIMEPIVQAAIQKAMEKRK